MNHVCLVIVIELEACGFRCFFFRDSISLWVVEDYLRDFLMASTRAFLHDCRLLAESLGYREDSTDCTVPCTPPRSEEDIYNSLDADFLPKKEDTGVQQHPLLKEILFKEEPRSVSSSNGSSPSSLSSTSSSPSPSSEYESSSALRELLFKGVPRKDLTEIPKPKVERAQNELTNPLQREEELFKDGQKSDHQLLREVLRDTSFQRKYNLRPVDLGGVGTGFVEDMEAGECVGDLAREQLEPVLSLAIQQLQKDFDNTCVALGIHPGGSAFLPSKEKRERSIEVLYELHYLIR